MSTKPLSHLVCPILTLSVALCMYQQPAGAQKDRPPARLQVYCSMFGGRSDSQVEAILQPLLEVMSEQIGYRFDLGLEHGVGPEGILKLGEKLNDGTYHLAAVWGLEYGWLVQKYPNLKALAVVSNGDRAPWRSQLMVRRQNVVALAQLKGKILARAKDTLMMDQLCLEEMLRKTGQNPRDFFKLEEPLPSVGEAIKAVKNGKADCLIINVTDFNRFEGSSPGLAKNLSHIEVSSPYPPPVLIGQPENLEKLQRGLWKKSQRVALRIHDTAEGQQCVRLFRFESFLLPDDRFKQEVENSVREFPIERALISK